MILVKSRFALRRKCLEFGKRYINKRILIADICQSVEVGQRVADSQVNKPAFLVIELEGDERVVVGIFKSMSAFKVANLSRKPKYFGSQL